MNEPSGVGGAEATAGGAYERPTRTPSFSVTSSPAEASLGPNLLENPTCTVDGQEVGEEPLYWTVEQGELECDEPEPDFMPDPREGDYVFIDWEDLEPSTDESIATQTVPVTGGSEYQFSVWVGSDVVDDDYAQFQVEFFDDGSPIGDGMIDSGEFQPEDPDEPEQYVATTEAPEHADEAVVRIILVNGGDFGLDRPLLWADDVRFQEFSDAPTAFDVSGVEMGIEQTLAPDWTLFDDEFGEDEDDRGFDDDGEITHFGGGDLGESVTDNNAGDTVTLAGGDLQVNADGTFSLTNPTQTGTFEFDYRLGYEGDHDDATVEIKIFDHELENPLCEEWDENAQDQPIGWEGEDFSCIDLTDPPFTDTDHTAIGERSFTDNYINLDNEVHTEQTVSVVGGETYTVSGLYGTDSNDYSGDVEFEYLDSDGDVISSEGFTLQELQSESSTEFDRFTETTDAPDDAKRATLRLTAVRPSGHQDPAGVYFDDFSLERGDPGEDPVNARDVETEVGIYHTFEPSETLFDDWGNGVDELGTPEAEVVNFGGGDLSGSVTDYGPGESVSFAGGTLTVESDGTFSLEEPTDVGTHTVEYEIENEHASSTATVEFWVRDSTLLDADCDPDSFEAWDDVSPGNGNIDCMDPQESGTAQPNGEQNPPIGSYAIGDRGGDGYDAVAEQTVPIRSGYTYELAGFVGSEATPEDSYATLDVDYLDEDGTELAVSEADDVDLSEMRSEGTTEFDAFSDTTVPPENATHATVRIFINSTEEMDLGGDAYARAYVDDLSFELLGTSPEANDVDNLSIGADETLTATVTTDGDESDGLGDPDAEVVSFGGGDLDGDATEYDVGQTAELAGGDLTIESDGSLELVAPSEDGTHQFDYRLENDAGYDDATVTIEVLAPNVTVIGTVTDTTFGSPVSDVGVEFTDGDGTYTTETNASGVYEAVVPGTGESYTVNANRVGWNEHQTTVTVGPDDETVTDVDLELTGDADVGITWRDNRTDERLEGVVATVESDNLGSTEFTSDDSGQMEFIVPSGPLYPLTTSKDGYRDRTIPMTPGPVLNYAIGGNAELTGSVTDGESGGGVEGATVTAENGAGAYTATTDADGTYEIDVLPGGHDYDVTIEADGYGTVVESDESVGDEATHTLDSELTGNATVEGTVEDEITADGIENADVAVVYPNDDAFTVEEATDTDGSFSIENVPGTNEEYAVVAEAPGYEAGDTAVAVDDGALADAGAIELEGNASVSGTIEDVTLEGIPDVDVTVSNGAREYTVTTNDDGQYTIENVPGTGEAYTVNADPGSWDGNSTTVTVGDGVEAQADLILTGSRTNTIEVHDRLFETAGEKYRIGNATVVIEHDRGGLEPTLGEATVTTGSDGSSVAVALPAMPTHLESGDTSGDDSLEYTASAEGYEPNTNWESLDIDIPISLTIAGTGSVSGTVVDEGTGDGIEDADVTLEYPTGEAVVFEDATDADGAYTIEDVPGTGEEYGITVNADGYETATFGVSPETGTNERTFELEGNAEIIGTVTDEVTGGPIENVTVTVENGVGTYNATTDENGEYTIENVPGTGDEYDVTADTAGYEHRYTSVTVGDGATETADLHLSGDAEITGTVTDALSEDGIEDGTVTATNGAGTYDATTSGAGEYTIYDVPGSETYDLEANHDDYVPTTRSDVTVAAGTQQTENVVLEPFDQTTVTGTVTDEVTGEPIAGADVAFELDDERVDTDLVFETETNTDGVYELTDLVDGYDYTLTAEADGYDVGTSSLRVGGDEEVDLPLTGDGALEFDVDGEQFGDGLEGATVEATPVDGAGTYGGSHTGDGTYTVTDLPSATEYAVTVTADGYETVAFDVLVEEPGITTASEPVSLEGDASLEVAAVDSLTDEALADVSVTIERESDGAQFEPASTTDVDGALAVTIPGTGEEYAVVANVTGYDESTVTTNGVDAGATVPVSIALEGDSTIEGTVSDRVTGDALDGVTVTADANGSVFETTTAANGSYELTAVPGERTYEVTLEASGYRSNSTTATPSAETVVVADSLWPAHDGDGTHEEPYRIANAAELQAIGADLDAHYALEGHVDASEADAWHDGDGFEPIGDDASPFTGSLDGQGNTISTLTVESRSSVGLFGVVDGGSIETLALENVSVTGDERVGGLVGSLSAGSVDGVAVSGTVVGEESVGGLVGSGGDVSTTASSATVEGTTAVGGLVGESDGDVSGSFAVGQVTGTTETGGLVGAGTPNVDASYWDATETTQHHSAGSPDANGVNTDTLVGEATQNTNLEFDETWAALDDEYPRHGWMVDDLELSLADDSLEPGETTEAIVTVSFVDDSTAYANETAAFSSADQDVVVFENSTIEAVGDGRTTLTATLVGFESTVTVEVEPRSSSSDSSSSGSSGAPVGGGGIGAADETSDDGDEIDGDGDETGDDDAGEIGDDAGEVGDEAGETGDGAGVGDDTGDGDGGEISDDNGDGQDERSEDTDRFDDTVPGFGLHLTLGVLVGLLLVLRRASACE
ncbi:beta strand repeat-containing protein [Natrarchaeobius sp. A-rgal3]|uniref:beta strand repeat-containing protein n=1 Tax=Natrarchaeobius versutus TaxID=1679078 RepID=UPI00350F9EAA